MKKLFTILLSLLMVVTITGMNVFAGAHLGDDANVEIEVIGNNYMTDDENVDESKVNKVYAVDIGWSSGFMFTYKFNANKPVYDTRTMTYTQATDDNAGWYANESATKKDTIDFTVTNRSNDEITVTPSFTDVGLTGTTALEVNDGTTAFANTTGTNTPFTMNKASVTKIGDVGTAVVKNLTMHVSGIPTYAVNDSRQVRAKLHLAITKDAN